MTVVQCGPVGAAGATPGESCLSNSTEGLRVPILVPAPLSTVPATDVTMVQ
ncbi:MAG: hypothetical protein ABR615_10170 [Pseudonocardiaceae bacterium]